MRVLLQRVREAAVAIDAVEVARIGPGLLVFVGISPEDDQARIDKLAQKTVKLRIFPEAMSDVDTVSDSGRAPAGMSRSVADIGGQLLVVSQFTLAADTSRGLRPSFSRAAPPPLAEPLYNRFVLAVEAALGKPVATGRFGADMQVSLVNDGPVTILLEA